MVTRELVTRGCSAAADRSHRRRRQGVHSTVDDHTASAHQARHGAARIRVPGEP